MSTASVNFRIADPKQGRINFSLDLRPHEDTDVVRVWRGAFGIMTEEGICMEKPVSKSVSCEICSRVKGLMVKKHPIHLDPHSLPEQSVYLLGVCDHRGMMKTSEYIGGTSGGKACAELVATFDGVFTGRCTPSCD